MINKLPILERPREKAKHFGISNLSNVELLSIIINQGPKNSSAFKVSTDLLMKAKDIKNIFNLSYQELKSIKGIGDAIAFKFLAIEELIKRKSNSSKEGTYICSFDIGSKYQNIIGMNEFESMYILGLNKDKIIYEKQMYKGTSSKFDLNEDEIISFLIKENLSRFIIVHNHPSGDPHPSKEDIISTNSLLYESNKFNLDFIDHIIVSKDSYYSFLDDDKMKLIEF